MAPGDEKALPDSLPSWPAFDDVKASLVSLRGAGFRLAILSNADPDLLAASIRQIGVPVDRTITVADAGSYKPAPGHWRMFFSRSGAERTRYAHVAASVFHDIAPCVQLGLRSVWINRMGESSDVLRAGELPTLAGLTDLLEDLVP